MIQNWISEIRALTSEGMFAFIALTSAMCITGTTLLSPALPSIAKGISVGSSQIGLIITAYTLPAIFVLPISGYLADNLGRDKVMAIGCFLVGLGGLAGFFATNLYQLVFVRVLQGIGIAGVMPTTVTLIGDLYSGSKEASAQGLRGTSNKIGSISWSLIGGILAGMTWNYVFLVYIIFIPLGLFAYFKVPSGKVENREPLKYLKGMKSVVERPKIAGLLFLGFNRMFIKYAVITYIPIMLKSRYSLAAAAIGGFMALRGVTGAVSSSTAGLFDQKFGKKITITAAFATIALTNLLLATTDSITIVVLMLASYGLMDSLFSALHKTILSQSIEEKHRAGLMTSNSLAQKLGATAAPLLIGAALFLQNEIYLYFITFISILSVLAFLLIEE